MKTEPGRFFEDFRLGETHPPRDAAHRHDGRRRALHRALRLALRGAVLGRLRQGGRLRAKPARRLARLPRRVRQDRARHLAQRRRQSRLRRRALPEAGLSRRDAVRRLRGHRPEGKLEPPDRHRLCPLDRLRRSRRAGADLLPLGAGAKARRRGAGARTRMCRTCRRRWRPRTLGAACPPIDAAAYDLALAGSPHRFGDYAVGERIDHRRRHDGRGGRASARDPALPEHGAGPFRRSTPRRTAASAGA